jgi:hypothetical protein
VVVRGYSAIPPLTRENGPNPPVGFAARRGRGQGTLRFARPRSGRWVVQQTNAALAAAANADVQPQVFLVPDLAMPVGPAA